MVNQQDDFLDQMQSVHDFLKSAKEWGLETEVVCWALQAMKNDPRLTLSQAMADGYYEWVK
jgi:hypothetical protein